MINIQVKGLKKIQEKLNKMDKQIKFSTALALTNTAKKARQELIKEMEQQFDRPTKFTLNSVFIVPANKKQSEQFAVVGIKDKSKSGTPAAKYLKQTIFGGKRRFKKSEGALKGKGIIPGGYYMIPGKKLRLNRFGNMTKGQIGKALTAKTSGSKFFVGRAGKSRTLGIWQRKGRKGRGVSSLVIFVKEASYKKQFEFYLVSEKAVKNNFENEFFKALKFAKSTAR